jgi:hypothetical protein
MRHRLRSTVLGVAQRFVQKRTQKAQAFDSATLPRWHFDGLLQILKRGLVIRRVGSGLIAGMVPSIRGEWDRETGRPQEPVVAYVRFCTNLCATPCTTGAPPSQRRRNYLELLTAGIF